MKNIFFSDDGRSLFGTRFGMAIEYDLAIDENGKCVLSIKPKMIQADGPYYPSHTKADMVSECAYHIAKHYHTVILKVYGKEVHITQKETVEEIHTKIIEQVKQIFTIDKTIPCEVQRQAKTVLNDLIRYIDIF